MVVRRQRVSMEPRLVKCLCKLSNGDHKEVNLRIFRLQHFRTGRCTGRNILMICGGSSESLEVNLTTGLGGGLGWEDYVEA